MSGNHGSPVDDGRSAVAGNSRPKLSKGAGFGVIGLIGIIALGFVWFNALAIMHYLTNN